MPTSKRWNKDELFIAMNLYSKLPFGHFDSRNKIIIKIAQKMGRTPSSLSMKLCNLASLDPDCQQRGIKGLKGVSKLDREIWQEFQESWSISVLKSEELFESLIQERDLEDFSDQDKDILLVQNVPELETETERLVKARIGQNLFRKAVLSAYQYKCCLTFNPIPELLIASHILPWSKYPEYRLNPSNGLCLSRNYDAAFDKGLISFDENYRMLISEYLLSFLPSPILEKDFLEYKNKQLELPDKKFFPDKNFLAKHRQEIFQGSKI